MIRSKQLDVEIRDAVTSDLETIVSFNQCLAEESEGMKLDRAILRRGVQRALSTPELCRYFVATLDGEVIGQTMVTYELTDWRDGVVHWIQSVYVQAAHRGQGVFSQLHKHVVEEAKKKGDCRCVRLYVEKNNGVAIATYEKLGMALSHYRVYELEMS